MRRRSHSLLSLTVVAVLVSLVMNYIVIELVLLDMCDELYCRKLVLLVINYIVHLNEYMYILTILEAPRRGGGQNRQWLKKSNHHICRLTDEYNGPRVRRGSPPGPNIFVGSPTNITDHLLAPPPRPITFIDHLSPMNIWLYSSVPTNLFKGEIFVG
jgi:hypothetical protein